MRVEIENFPLPLNREVREAQPSGLQPHAPSDFEIGDAHFKADYYYSEKDLRMGTPFLLDLSPRFLSPLSNLPIQPQWEILNPSPQNLFLEDAFSKT